MSRPLAAQIAILLGFPGDEFHRVGTQCIGDQPENRQRRTLLSAFDIADITSAQATAMGQFLLRHVHAMTGTTQVHRHDPVEIHAESGTLIRTIRLGTIVPIRQEACYCPTGFSAFWLTTMIHASKHEILAGAATVGFDIRHLATLRQRTQWAALTPARRKWSFSWA
jgi:hypothetical protein